MATRYGALVRITLYYVFVIPNAENGSTNLSKNGCIHEKATHIYHLFIILQVYRCKLKYDYGNTIYIYMYSIQNYIIFFE